MELKSTDLGSISSLLEHVCLPVVLGKLAASGAEEAEDMARLARLLREAIDAIVREAEEY